MLSINFEKEIIINGNFGKISCVVMFPKNLV